MRIYRIGKQIFVQGVPAGVVSLNFCRFVGR
jgi:hypothetical protein